MRARALGHSLHPILIVFPIGLLVVSLVWDIVYLAGGNAFWAAFAYWSIVAGIVAALIAAVPGFVDWLAIPRETRAKRVGLTHMLVNVGALALFALSLGLRAANGYEDPAIGEMIWSWIGIAGLSVAGWLGGELVERMGVGVYEDANLNAPSSLRARGAEPRAEEPLTGPGSRQPV